MIEPIIRSYMMQSVAEASDDCDVQLLEATKLYVADVLASYMDAGVLGPQRGMPVLAWLYRDAIEASGHIRTEAYKRLGDASLFLSGMFIDYIRSTPMGLGYYIDMCSTAYYTVAHVSTPSHPVFDELSKKLPRLVAMINTISSRSSLGTNIDSDAALDLYIRDGSSDMLQRQVARLLAMPVVGPIGLS